MYSEIHQYSDDNIHAYKTSEYAILCQLSLTHGKHMTIVIFVPYCQKFKKNMGLHPKVKFKSSFQNE